jgi:hypothetical protein
MEEASMAMIKITKGVFLWKNGIVRAGDPPIEVDDAQARRLVEQKGVAEYVTSFSDIHPDVERAAAEPAGKAYHIGMTAKELREIGAEYGLTFKQGISKAEMVEEMDALFESLKPAEDAPTFDAAEAVQ